MSSAGRRAGRAGAMRSGRGGALADLSRNILPHAASTRPFATRERALLVLRLVASTVRGGRARRVMHSGRQVRPSVVSMKGPLADLSRTSPPDLTLTVLCMGSSAWPDDWQTIAHKTSATDRPAMARLAAHAAR